MNRAMSREMFRAWAERQPSRFERVDGRPVAMAPERVVHAGEARIWRALDAAIRQAGLCCEALPDGVTVEIDEATD